MEADYEGVGLADLEEFALNVLHASTKRMGVGEVDSSPPEEWPRYTRLPNADGRLAVTVGRDRHYLCL